jgi:hypothetical protein
MDQAVPPGAWQGRGGGGGAPSPQAGNWAGAAQGGCALSRAECAAAPLACDDVEARVQGQPLLGHQRKVFDVQLLQDGACGAGRAGLRPASRCLAGRSCRNNTLLGMHSAAQAGPGPAPHPGCSRAVGPRAWPMCNPAWQRGLLLAACRWQARASRWRRRGAGQGQPTASMLLPPGAAAAWKLLLLQQRRNMASQKSVCAWQRSARERDGRPSRSNGGACGSPALPTRLLCRRCLSRHACALFHAHRRAARARARPADPNAACGDAAALFDYAAGRRRRVKQHRGTAMPHRLVFGPAEARRSREAVFI